MRNDDVSINFMETDGFDTRSRYARLVFPFHINNQLFIFLISCIAFDILKLEEYREWVCVLGGIVMTPMYHAHTETASRIEISCT